MSVVPNNQAVKTATLPKDQVQMNKKSQDKPFHKMLQDEKSLDKAVETEDSVYVILHDGVEVEDTLSFLEKEGLEEMEGAFELLNMLLTNNQEAIPKLEFIQQHLGENPSEAIKEALRSLVDSQDTFKEIDFTQLPPGEEDIETLKGLLTNGLAKPFEGLTNDQKNAFLTLLNFGKLVVMSHEHTFNPKGTESVGQLDALLLNWKDKLTAMNETKKAIPTDVKNNPASLREIGMNTYNLQSKTYALNFKNGGSIAGFNPVPAKSADIPLNQPVMIGELQLQTQQQSPVLTLEKGGQAVGADEFIKSFESLLAKANYTNQNGIQRLFVRLTPENLGTLQIELIQKDGQLVAKIIANTQKGKELLESQLQGLRVSLATQGIDFDKIDLEQSQDALFQEESPSEERRNQHEHQEDHNVGDHDEELFSGFSSVLEESIINQEI